MNYLITAAGLGKRFIKEGIKPPKPLIKADGLELIFWSLSTFDFKSQDNLYIVSLKKDNVKKRVFDKLSKFYSNLNIFWLEISELKNGQLLTALEAIRFFKISGKLVIHNCDTSYDLGNFNFEKIEKCFGLIPYATLKGDNWSFLKIKDGLVYEVKEKKRISDNCSLGTYYFSSALKFQKIAEEFISKNKNYLKEYYIAPIYDYAIEKSLKVFSLECKKVRLFGTPSELLDTFNLKFFELLSDNDFKGHQRKTIVIDIDGTLCSEPFMGDYLKCKPIPEVCKKLRQENEIGTYIILYTSRNMRSFQGNIGLINKYTSYILHEWLEKEDIPYDELHFGKPWGKGNLNYIDDKLISINEFLYNDQN